MSASVLWWGRSDPRYARNRVVRGLFHELGWNISDFRPLFSATGDIEASCRVTEPPTLIWVPCFRQRDLGAALRFGRRKRIPVIADPLISAWDKQVFERHKFAPGSAAALRLKLWESELLQACDAVIADTPAHARFFAETLGVPSERIHVLWVGAEAGHFRPTPIAKDGPVEALFVGSFIGLHGTETIVEAARYAKCSGLVWTLLGSGPERIGAERRAMGVPGVRFDDPVSYENLPARIASAHIILGVFAASEKAGRVIPNKVFQGLACGRPVVTRSGTGYPDAISRDESGLVFIPPEEPIALADSVCRLAEDGELRAHLGSAASGYFQRLFGSRVLKRQLAEALAKVELT